MATNNDIPQCRTIERTHVCRHPHTWNVQMECVCVSVLFFFFFLSFSVFFRKKWKRKEAGKNLVILIFCSLKNFWSIRIGIMRRFCFFFWFESNGCNTRHTHFGLRQHFVIDRPHSLSTINGIIEVRKKNQYIYAPSLRSILYN